MFVPAVASTSLVVTHSNLIWDSIFGLPEWIISDGGSHFNNELMEDLVGLLGVHHHITLSYCPWTNDSVKAVGKGLSWTHRGMVSEFRKAADEWDVVLPVINYVINHRNCQVLGGRSAVKVMTVRTPDSVVQMAVWIGTLLKDSVQVEDTMDATDSHCESLYASLEQLHE